MKKYKTRIHIRIIIFFVLAVLAVGGFPSAIIPNTGMIASADSVHTRYSTVREDLSKDPDFDIADYPEDNTDYSVQVIQIAESTDGELFVYTYQPCQNAKYLMATEINMSLSESVNGTILYPLSLISVSGVFCKYKVNNVKVSGEETRYYNITSIYREWIKDIDKESSNDNIKNEVSFAVGKIFVASGIGDRVSYLCRDIETILIKDKYCGYLRFKSGSGDGLGVFNESYDGFYVAFSADRKIDRLINAKVCYVPIHVQCTLLGGITINEVRTEGEKTTVNLNEVDEAFVEGKTGLFGISYKSHTWKRIQSVNDFILKNDLKESVKKDLAGKDWVLRFAEYKYEHNGFIGYDEFKTEVNEVTILQLEFETDKQVYNLGVVDNKQSVSPNQPPDNNNISEKADFWEWLDGFMKRLFSGLLKPWEWILLILALPLLLLVLGFMVFIIFCVVKLVVYIVKNIAGLFRKNE